MISKKKTILCSLLVLFALSLGIFSNPAFADHATASVSLPEGTAVPGCEKTDECYVPYEVTVDVGGEVTWSNDDIAAHTVTSGNPEEGPSGEFNSLLFSPGETFEYKFESEGEFPYYCMVHTWMKGMVTVQDSENSEPKTSEPKTSSGSATSSEPAPGTIIVGAPSEEETTVSGISDDGKLRAEITASNPASDEVMSLQIKFRDSTGSVQKHANYDIIVTQNGQEVLSILGAHEHEGIGMHSTSPLSSDDKVDIKVTVLGFGLPDDEENWNGPKGEILMFNVVPEFGAIVTIVLFVSIASVVLVSSKYTRVIPDL